jgi:hypothetical protein
MYLFLPINPLNVKLHIYNIIISSLYTMQCSIDELALGGIVVIVLAIGPNVRRFKPGRGRWIFKDCKHP